MGFVSRPRLGKYNSKSAVYKGHLYHSLKEARYASELDIRVRAGELKEWRRQVHIPLKIGPVKICTYIVDFVEVFPDGHERYVEIKGYETDVYKLKAKLLKALHPKMDYQVVK
jgi:hypothetical protein